MKYPYLVKHNGVMYAPGMEVPDNVKKTVEKEDTVEEVNEELEESPRKGRKK